MTKKDLIALSVAAGFIILWLLFDREKLKKKINGLEKDIETNDNLNKDIKKKLKDLIGNNKEIDPEVANELSQIAALIEIKQETKAILSIVKVVEKLLVKIYENDGRLKAMASKNNRKRPAFMDYLELALTDKVISKEDFHLISVAKIIRDEEAHNLDIEKEKSRVLSSFVSCFGIVLTLCRIVKARLSSEV